MRAVKTKDFARIRIGISGVGKKHQAKKVSGEEKVIKHVIGKWKPSEEAAVKKVLKKVAEAARLFADVRYRLRNAIREHALKSFRHNLISERKERHSQKRYTDEEGVRNISSINNVRG